MTKRKAPAAVGKAEDLYASNPLVGAIIAAAVGAVFGSALPIIRQEQSKLESPGGNADDQAAEQADDVTAQTREKKDRLLDKADPALKQLTSPSPRTEAAAAGRNLQQLTPFIAGR